MALALPPLELGAGEIHILLALPWLKGVEERKRLVEHIPEMVGGMAGRTELLVQGREVALVVILVMVVNAPHVQIPLVVLVLAVAAAAVV